MIKQVKKADTSYLKDIKELLRDRKYRNAHHKFIVEGKKIVDDIIKTRCRIDSVLCSSSYLKNFPDQIVSISSQGIPIYSVNDPFFEKISVLRSSQGILAVLNKPVYDIDILKKIPGGLIVLLDNIQDPGNLGALIRTSVAFNASAVLLYGNTADVFNPKVVRASSGMLLNVPVLEAGDNTLDELKKNGFRILTADNSSEKSISILKIRPETPKNIVVFGNEGQGVSPVLLNITDEIFFIPINKNVESLNVAAACSISLFYFQQKKQ